MLLEARERFKLGKEKFLSHVQNWNLNSKIKYSPQQDSDDNAITRLRAWDDQGIHCEHNNCYHQPYLKPWWSGSSVFKEHPDYQLPIATRGDETWYHNIDLARCDAWDPKVGEYLTSPAERKTLPKRVRNRWIEGDEFDCFDYINYDLHAVYISNTPMPPAIDQYTVIVHPIGKLWIDPEGYDRRRFCCERALITEVLNYDQWQERESKIAKEQEEKKQNEE